MESMGQVDAVYFSKDWRTSRGCRIERQVCEAYGVKILEYDFLDKFKEEVLTRDPFNKYMNLIECKKELPGDKLDKLLTEDLPIIVNKEV